MRTYQHWMDHSKAWPFFSIRQLEAPHWYHASNQYAIDPCSHRKATPQTITMHHHYLHPRLCSRWLWLGWRACSSLERPRWHSCSRSHSMLCLRPHTVATCGRIAYCSNRQYHYPCCHFVCCRHAHRCHYWRCQGSRRGWV